MRLSGGLLILVSGFALSQFYRAFLAVLATMLERDIGVGPDQLATSSGLWFVSFAAMQLPVGWALDRFGPRRVIAWLFGIGAGGGSIVFALAQVPWHLHVSMILIGAGCAPVLMGAYVIIARTYPPAAFGTMAGVLVGLGGAGNLLGAAPLERVAHLVGWRPTMLGLALTSLLIAALTWRHVKDPPPAGDGPKTGSLIEILRIGALWWLLPVSAANYAAVAALRGVWTGPYLAEVFAATDQLIGNAALLMGVAMVLGSFVYGPLATRIGTKKAGAYGAAGTALCLLFLTIAPADSLAASIIALTLLGFIGANYAILMAHGRAFMPAHLVGRGITFLNMVSLGGVAALQFGSRPVYHALMQSRPVAEVYSSLFMLFLLPLVAGLALFLFSPEAPDDVRT